MLTASEIRLILEALEAKYGRGYSSVKEVGRLQAKLSIMLEVAGRTETPDIRQILSDRMVEDG